MSGMRALFKAVGFKEQGHGIVQLNGALNSQYITTVLQLLRELATATKHTELLPQIRAYEGTLQQKQTVSSSAATAATAAIAH
eukprot:15461-Heterococcus_DN1.PRE.2